jgi:hypothetical protein
VEPMNPQTRKGLLKTSPQASPEDVAEYERLLAHRFTVDPSIPRAPADDHAANARDARLRELYARLYLA